MICRHVDPPWSFYVIWRGRINSSPIKNRHVYFLRVERDGLLVLGARCDRALPAAVFDGLLVRLSRNTFEAALAARALVLRCPDITLLPFHYQLFFPLAVLGFGFEFLP